MPFHSYLDALDRFSLLVTNQPAKRGAGFQREGKLFRNRQLIPMGVPGRSSGNVTVLQDENLIIRCSFLRHIDDGLSFRIGFVPEWPKYGFRHAAHGNARINERLSLLIERLNCQRTKARLCGRCCLEFLGHGFICFRVLLGVVLGDGRIFPGRYWRRSHRQSADHRPWPSPSAQPDCTHTRALST